MEILMYLLKSTAVLTLFFVVYELFLKRETFFAFNRFFLLFGMLIAFSLPAITFTKTIVLEEVITTAAQTNSEVFSGFAAVPEAVATEKESFLKTLKPIHFVGTLYVLGSLFFLGKFFLGIFRLGQILRYRPKSYKENRIRYIETDRPTNPFTFFNFIVYNPEKYDSSELQMMLHHEKVHSKNRHSVDILLGQLMLIFHWFNPFAWLYSKRIDQNLEFIADAETAEIAKEKKTYQLSLLKKAYSGAMPLPVNNFHSFTKIRILMLNQTQSKRRNSLKALFVLPLLALFFMSFQMKTIHQTEYISDVITENDSITDEKVEVLDKIFRKYDPETMINFNGIEMKIKAIPEGVYRVEEVEFSNSRNPKLTAKAEDEEMAVDLQDWTDGVYILVRGGGIVVVEKDAEKNSNQVFVYKEKNATASNKNVQVDLADKDKAVEQSSKPGDTIKAKKVEIRTEDSDNIIIMYDLGKLDEHTQQIIENALKERGRILEESDKIIEESKEIREKKRIEVEHYRGKKREELLKEREHIAAGREYSGQDRMAARDSVRNARLRSREKIREAREKERQQMADLSGVEGVMSVSENGMTYQKAENNEGKIEVLQFQLDKNTTDAQLDLMQRKFAEVGIQFKAGRVKRNASGEITDIQMTLNNGKNANTQVSQQGSSQGIGTYILGSRSDNNLFIIPKN